MKGKELSRVFEVMAEEYRNENWSKRSTMASNVARTNKLLAAIGDKRLDRINLADIDKIIMRYHPIEGDAGVYRLTTHLIQIIRYAWLKGIIAKANILGEVKKPTILEYIRGRIMVIARPKRRGLWGWLMGRAA